MNEKPRNSHKYLFSFIILGLSLLLSIEALTQINQNRQKKNRQNQDHYLAFDYYKKRDFEKAVIYFEKLFKNTKSNSYFNYYLNCLIELHKYEKAEEVVKNQMKRIPDYYKYHVDLGYIYELQGKSRKARREYDQVFDNLPPEKNTLSQISNAFLYKKQYDLAVKTLEEGRKLLRNQHLFNIELANVYYSTGNFEKMIDLYLEQLAYDYSSMHRIKSRLQLIINAGTGNEIMEMLRVKLLKKTQDAPNEKAYTEMLLWLSIQKKDFDFALIQAKAIDQRFERSGKQVFQLAELCEANHRYDVAVKAYIYILKYLDERSMFFIKSRMGLLNAKFELLKSNPDHTQKDVKKIEKSFIKTLEELGRNAGTIEMIRSLARLRAFYLYDYQSSAELLEESLEIPGLPDDELAECKLLLGDIYMFMDEIWEASLLYSQVDKKFKEEPLGHEARFRNARLFYFAGEFPWAKMKLDVLKAATSKLIANDAMHLSLLINDNTNMDSTTWELAVYAKADLLFYQNRKEESEILLDSLINHTLTHPVLDEALYKLAEIAISNNDYSKADSLLQIVHSTYHYDILADDALFLRAEINEKKLDNLQLALDLYQLILTDYPGSVLEVEARKRFRALRGDAIN